MNFQEHEDLEIYDYKRIRESIEHEDQLIHYRLTALITTQSALGAGFVFLSSGHKPWCLLIAFLGACISVFIGKHIAAAEAQLQALVHWWLLRAIDHSHPPICGLAPARSPSARDALGVRQPAGRVQRGMRISILSWAFATMWAFGLTITAQDILHLKDGKTESLFQSLSLVLQGAWHWLSANRVGLAAGCGMTLIAVVLRGVSINFGRHLRARKSKKADVERASTSDQDDGTG
jgi:hypothetical protein